MFRCSPVVWSGFVLLLACTTPATAAETGPWIRGVFTGSSPRPLVAAEEIAWQRASELAENVSGGFVLVGSGHSMQPLYEPDTILVLRHLPFDELRRGQTALYRNREGTAYIGRCPRCGAPVRVPIGDSGTSERFFTAVCP